MHFPFPAHAWLCLMFSPVFSCFPNSLSSVDTNHYNHCHCTENKCFQYSKTILENSKLNIKLEKIYDQLAKKLIHSTELSFDSLI